MYIYIQTYTSTLATRPVALSDAIITIITILFFVVVVVVVAVVTCCYRQRYEILPRR